MGKDAKTNTLEKIKTVNLTPRQFKEINGTIVNKFNYHSLKKICIITEDSGNGFQFVTSYVLQNYPYMSGIIIGSTGKDGVRYILEEYTDYNIYVFVIDRGISETEFDALSETIQQFKKGKEGISIYIFQPQCMEEVWLSFYKLDKYIKLNNSIEALDLQNKLERVLQGELKNIDYTQYKTLQASTPEQICEKLVWDLTDGTPFKCYHGQKKIKGVQPYIPAYLSPCWRCPCCTVTDYDNSGYVKAEDCKKPGITENKLDYIAQHSLLCGLTYIIDKIYGFQYHSEGYWHNIKKSYFDELIKEL